MINKVILIGNLGRDPEVRATQSGTSVVNFSLATSRKWTDRNSNERKEETEWHNIVVFGRQAEVAAQYLTKGKQIYLEGRLRTSSWEDRQTNEKKYRTEVICENFQMLGRRDENMGGGAGGGGGYRPSGSDSGPDIPEGDDEDDIPF